MYIGVIFGIVCCVITMVTIVVTTSIIRHLKSKIFALQLESTKYRNYTRYQQKVIEGLKEHNGNLYDENNSLKCRMNLENIPDFRKDW
jgi:hypothetical protein